MISIRKYLENKSEPKLAEAALNRYMSTLAAMGESGAAACPTVGVELQQSLLSLGAQLASSATTESIEETGAQAEERIRDWGARSAEYYRQKAAEIRDLMLVVARTTQSVGERDSKYQREFTEMTSRLESLADLDDISAMRRSLVQSASQIKACVDKMAREGEEALAELRAEVQRYESKLAEVEKEATVDALTGLANRRWIDLELERKASGMRQYAVILLDLNGFKPVNDKYGHAAGDQLLRQFAAELRAACRSGDVVGRLGGDEFVVITECAEGEARALVERITQWVFGEYTIDVEQGPAKVKVDASVGWASAGDGETGALVLERADREMYRDKAARKQRR